jgi:serine/threonine-protein kinase RsbW
VETKEIKFTITSRLENVSLLGAAVNKLCSANQFSGEDAHAIELCVVEAVVNSIKHGYGGKPDHFVDVIFHQEPDHIAISILDTGKPMDPKLLKEKKPFAIQFEPEVIEKIPKSGRGLPIILGYMDDVRYLLKGNEKHLILIKKIA